MQSERQLVCKPFCLVLVVLTRRDRIFLYPGLCCVLYFFQKVPVNPKTTGSKPSTVLTIQYNQQDSTTAAVTYCAHLPTVRISRTWRAILSTHQQCFIRYVYLVFVLIWFISYCLQLFLNIAHLTSNMKGLKICVAPRTIFTRN